MNEQRHTFADLFVKTLEFLLAVLRLWFGDPRTRIPKFLIVASIPLIASPWWQPVLYSTLDQWLQLDLSIIEHADQLMFVSGWILLAIGIGLYLYVRPKGEEKKLNPEACLATAQTKASLIVDLMRMLYVVSNDEARSANIDRYSVFVEMATNHFLELRSQSARFANQLPAELLNLSAIIERDCAWVFGQIKGPPDVTYDLDRCYDTMQRAASQTFDYCSRAIPDTFPTIVRDVDAAMAAVPLPQHADNTQLFRNRLSVQTRLLENQSSNPTEVRTIAHDVSQDVGLYYFVIDYRLLNVAEPAA